MDIFFLFFVFVSCENKNVVGVILDIDKATQHEINFKLSQITSKIEYIPLETEDECLINENTIRFVGLIKGHLLIADQHGCYLFEKDGKFVRKIGFMGDGPGGYLEINNVYIDNSEDNIYITSTHGNGILIYNKEGDFLGTILNDIKFQSQWTFVGDNIIALNTPNYTGNSNIMLSFLEINGDTLSRISNYDYFQREGAPLNLNNMSLFYNYENHFFCYRIFNDTLYRINAEYTISPAYIFYSSKHKVNNSLRSDGNRFANTDVDFILPWQILETDRFLFVNMFRNKKGLIPYLYDKESNDFGVVKIATDDNTYGFENDLDHKTPFFPQYQLNGNLVCMVLNTDQVLEWMNKVEDKSKSIHIDKYMNPVISIIELK